MKISTDLERRHGSPRERTASRTVQRPIFVSLLIVACATLPAPGAIVSWGPVNSGIEVGDVLETGSPFLAVNGGKPPIADIVVGTNAFTVGGFDRGTSSRFFLNGELMLPGGPNGVINSQDWGDFGWAPHSGSFAFDDVLDSYTRVQHFTNLGEGRWTRGHISIIGLTVGNTYEAQFISANSEESVNPNFPGTLSERTLFMTDGNGNDSGDLTRGLGDWVVGTFVADDTEQEFAAVGEYEVMLQGWVVRDLGAAIPEPGVALCSCTALLLMAVRRRGTV